MERPRRRKYRSRDSRIEANDPQIEAARVTGAAQVQSARIASTAQVRSARITSVAQAEAAKTTEEGTITAAKIARGAVLGVATLTVGGYLGSAAINSQAKAPREYIMCAHDSHVVSILTAYAILATISNTRPKLDKGSPQQQPATKLQ
ncbi:hypothetical protein MMC10_008488 [Thelotrema lepadinum]|nr:hypothetical protein [Thelotrema lepadinum]